MRKNSMMLGLILGIVLFVTGVLSGCGGEKKDCRGTGAKPGSASSAGRNDTGSFCQSKTNVRSDI